MEADELERTVCSERGKEKSFFGEKFSSPLGLCCFFLAASAVFFWSPASAAALAGMVLLFFGRMSRREGIPFCPFIALGGVAAYGAEVFQLPFFPSWHCFI